MGVLFHFKKTNSKISKGETAIDLTFSRVAALAAVEKVNLAMPTTIEAAVLSKIAECGQLGDVIVDGPLTFDNYLLHQ